MVDIKIKLDKKSDLSEFSKGIGVAIEQYVVQTFTQILKDKKELEEKIINYYLLNKDEDYKNYFNILEENADKDKEVTGTSDNSN